MSEPSADAPTEGLTAHQFAKWLQGLVDASPEQRAKMTRPDVTTDAVVYAPSDPLPSFVAVFPGGTFVVMVDKTGPRDPLGSL